MMGGLEHPLQPCLEQMLQATLSIENEYVTTVVAMLHISQIHRGKHLDSEETKQERREKRLVKKRDKMAQHGRSLVRIYRDAVLKRFKRGRKKGS